MISADKVMPRLRAIDPEQDAIMAITLSPGSSANKRAD
jgi:hypothetical protein